MHIHQPQQTTILFLFFLKNNYQKQLQFLNSFKMIQKRRGEKQDPTNHATTLTTIGHHLARN